MDASGSIRLREFDLLKRFIKEIIEFLQIGPTLTHIGLIEYSTKATLQLKFDDTYDKKEVQQRVDIVPHTRGLTRIDLALKIASEQLFTPQGGMRPNSRKV
jgi:hypothetical protein